MDIDPKDLLEEKERREELELEADRAKIRLNSLVAITIALLATFMGVCKIKDENIVLSMQKAQSKSIDSWNYYQARNIREEIMRSTALTLSYQAGAGEQSKRYVAMADEQNAKKSKVQDEARAYDEQYERLHERHDQFDLEDAALAISVSLFAITSLTQKKWMYALACVPAAAGIAMGLAGLFNFALRPEWLTKMLG